jgi:hypothetical protein
MWKFCLGKEWLGRVVMARLFFGQNPGEQILITANSYHSLITASSWNVRGMDAVCRD